MTAHDTGMQCPDEEMLAAFIDGRLDPADRDRVIEHAAFCAECRDILGEASEFVASEGEPEVLRGRFGSRALIPVAALAAAALLALLFLGPIRDSLGGRDGIASLVTASQPLQYRAGDGRLAGGFPWRPLKPVTRGAGDGIPDASSQQLYAAAGRIQNDDDLHALGVAHLLLGNRDGAVQALERALAQGDADRHAVEHDLAAALIARGAWNADTADLERALEISEQAYKRKPTPENAWNRAAALEHLARNEAAVHAWDDYLRLDGTSEWAAEARRRRGEL